MSETTRVELAGLENLAEQMHQDALRRIEERERDYPRRCPHGFCRFDLCPDCSHTLPAPEQKKSPA